MRGVLITLVVAAGSLVAAASSETTRSQSSDPQTPKLFKDSRLSFAMARAQGRRDIVLVVASVPDRAAAVARIATRMGGSVRFRDDAVGYLRVRISLDSAVTFSEVADVEGAAADTDDSYPSRLPATGGPLSAPNDTDPNLLLVRQEQWPPRTGDLPLRSPYSPLRDIGAHALLTKNPSYDGRGVTIAVLDGTIDMLLPEFQSAHALDGTRVPKFADILTTTDPRDDAALNPQWVEMSERADGSRGTVSSGGKTLSVPRPGAYRIGFFDERRFNMPSNAAYIEQDVDRNGNPKGDDGLFGVLWDERTNDVWVDTDRDLSFADERAMTDYAKRGDIGVFGRDDPATPIRESIGFAVQTDAENKFVAINLGMYQHATGIMGSVAGNPDAGGRIRGIAPGARLVSMSYGVSNLHAAIEGMIRAFRHPLVDLIVFEQSVVMASIPYLLADGRHPISIIASRLTTQHGKLMFVPGSNTPGFGIVAEDGLAPGVVSVGGYQSRESYLANLGLPVEDDDNMHYGGLSHGPSGTGALKPDLLAPSGQISTDVGYRAGATRRGLFRLPPGYSVDGGTSTATPMAAGAAALVVSAAKQRGLRYDAARLKAALQGSARPIPRLAANEQGAGLVQVEAAIALLEKLSHVEPVDITSRAPVRTALSHLLHPPHEGTGLYEREGWVAGDTGTRVITLTRRNGPRGSLKFALRLVGNDGTFAVPSTVDLSRGAAAQIRVHIAPRSWGAHTAALLVEGDGWPAPVYRTLLTVVAAQPLNTTTGFRAETTIAVPRVADRSVFVHVPPGMKALLASATSPDGPVRVALISPERDHLSPCGFPPTSVPCALPDPMPGVWEINLANTDVAYDEAVTAPRQPARMKVVVSAVDVNIEGPAGEKWAGVGATDFTTRVTNRGAAITSASLSGAIGSARSVEGTLTAGGQYLTELDVPAGVTGLRATLAVADPTADLDLYLLDCTRQAPPVTPYRREDGGRSPAAPPASCVPRARAANGEAGGVAEVIDPAPGRWVLAVDAFRARPGVVRFRLTDSWTHPRFGALALAGTPGDLSASATWTGAAHLWLASLPDPPRVPYAQLIVTNPQARRMMFGEGGLRSVSVPLGVLGVSGSPAHP